METVLAAFPDRRIRITRSAAGDGVEFGEGTWTGTTAAGDAVTIEGTVVIDLANGKMRSQRGITSPRRTHRCTQADMRYAAGEVGQNCRSAPRPRPSCRCVAFGSTREDAVQFLHCHWRSRYQSGGSHPPQSPLSPAPRPIPPDPAQPVWWELAPAPPAERRRTHRSARSIGGGSASAPAAEGCGLAPASSHPSPASLARHGVGGVPRAVRVAIERSLAVGCLSMDVHGAVGVDDPFAEGSSSHSNPSSREQRRGQRTPRWEQRREPNSLTHG